MKKIVFLLIIAFISCKKEPKKATSETPNNIPVKKEDAVDIPIEYAKGFSIQKQGNLTIIKVNAPWPNARKTYTYALIDKKKMETIRINSSLYDAVIPTPVNRLVATSTTHIPAIEALGVENTLIGFPGTNYVSSKKVRKKIDEGKVTNLGLNESINTEVLVNLQPELIMGFTVEGQNKTYSTIENAGIPVVYNGDWVEETPLGKAEWIKFFGPFFQKGREADSIFNSIAKSYQEAKTLATTAKNKPTVLSGSMFKDIWYVPAGKSWVAHFLEDANANYLWKDSFGTGSLSLNFETVLEKAKNADFWIGPGQFVSYNQLKETNKHYTQFKAYKDKKVYTYSLATGVTGGLLYYELAPNRPDIVLKDIIHILHPEILPDYKTVFFKQLQP
ncbi:ABC transporter substrate-binding protein [Galbibacter pacificus]|uniref:ABC transporter substrate-binding protein n=1 Tax=Galbibacter pacificus TaxID=2996052 RepID=A0ABT6FP59_9FLAO|nr:ABC transporter substrate-binding protein [Galbibacter pacificus]MDG3581532.1 ABC transporter substrate-binding protein [Galbibacter pacificus]MDG3585010.1 ABC transporter substrate-binding protein [Galbibacter pacificus]